jgi:D-sedoheptulose 7-phosphate isomerase
VRTALAPISARLVSRIVGLILEAHRDRRHVYVLGNGGSAATASHFACDLSKATVVGGRPRLRVTALGDNVALLTAWANDSGFERVFAEPLLNQLDPGDVVIAISASGNSPNVVEAVRIANEIGATTVGLLGFTGGKLLEMVALPLRVQSHDYGVVEDCHMVLGHAITASAREALVAD